MSSDDAILHYGNEEITLPIVEGVDGPIGLDISRLRGDHGLVTFDYGFANTAGTESEITFINGEAGELRHRGYSIEDLAAHCSFLEVAYLLINGELPNADELEQWTTNIKRHTLLNEEMKGFFDAFPTSAHPMAILSSATSAISTFYEKYHDPGDTDAFEESAKRLIAKMPTIAAFAHKKSTGQPYMYPRNDLDYASNFLHMMFGLPVEETKIDPLITQALDVLLILHADHSQNCSTATVRFVGSSRANLFASVAAGMSALWGPLHGGANQEVVEMLSNIHKDPDADVDTYIAKAKDRDDPFRLMGFGHRVYRNYDPRAKILKEFAHDVLRSVAGDDPLLAIAERLEQVALEDEYFVERRLYPNVDFYSGIIFRALGFPAKMFTVLFAIGRLPGWIANYREMASDPKTRIARPRQIYTGNEPRDFVPITER